MDELTTVKTETDLLRPGNVGRILWTDRIGETLTATVLFDSSVLTVAVSDCDPLITARQFAQELVRAGKLDQAPCYTTITRWMKAGKVKFYPIGGKPGHPRHLIPFSEVERFKSKKEK